MAHKPSKAEAAESQPPPDDEPDDVDDELIRRVRQPVSVPAKASCLTFVFLIVLSAAALFYEFLHGMPYDRWWHYLVVAALDLIIPIVVYRAVTLWMFDESARYPDIAYAWNAGISELAL